MTKEEWLKHLESRKYLMDRWDSNESFEIYTTTLIDKAIGEPDLWNDKYSDEEGPLWCLHLYAEIKGDNIEYWAFLWTDVEKGESEPYDIHIPEELKEALDIMVRKEYEK